MNTATTITQIDAAPSLRSLVLSESGGRARETMNAIVNAQYSAQTATRFEELKARLDQVDVIVMELHLKDIDGIEVIRFLGQQVNQPEIIFTSNLDPRILSAASRLAASKGLHVRATLKQPVDPQALLRALALPPRADDLTAQTPMVMTDHQHLRRGLVNDEFVVYFQPKIDVETLQLASVEALVRWKHPEYGMLGPNAFITLAEKSGLITPLTEVVVEKSFGYAAYWRSNGIPLKIAINVSGASLADLKLPDKLSATAKKFELSPDNIVVEITESWVAKNSVDALDILTRLRMKGFNLSIDDFGTGYSTMLKLKQIPFSELKLDQSIIRGAVNDVDSRAIVETSIELGQKLGLHLVAEGVELQDDWDLISELGCNEGQGYFIARPMKPKDLPDWLHRWNLSLGI